MKEHKHGHVRDSMEEPVCPVVLLMYGVQGVIAHIKILLILAVVHMEHAKDIHSLAVVTKKHGHVDEGVPTLRLCSVLQKIHHVDGMLEHGEVVVKHRRITGMKHVL